MRSVGGTIRGGGGGAVDTSALTAKWVELEVITIIRSLMVAIITRSSMVAIIIP